MLKSGSNNPNIMNDKKEKDEKKDRKGKDDKKGTVMIKNIKNKIMGNGLSSSKGGR